MLVIGIQQDGTPFYSDLDVDADTDSPRSIHDLLSKKAKGALFEHILCIEEDVVVADFINQEDYDLTETSDNDTMWDDLDDENDDGDNLHEDEDDEDDD
jgi:hypothetical protein